MSEDVNPWKVLSSEVRYENSWIRLTHHEVLNPSGKEGIYGKVHFKNVALGIIPVDEEDHTWLVGQFRFSLDHYSWEIPMGGGPLGENLLENAKRELLEETGLKASNWQLLMKLHTSNSVTDEVGFVYMASGLSMHQAAFEETEDIQIKRLPLHTAISMALNGEITDAISVAGLLKLHLMRRDGRI